MGAAWIGLGAALFLGATASAAAQPPATFSPAAPAQAPRPTPAPRKPKIVAIPKKKARVVPRDIPAHLGVSMGGGAGDFSGCLDVMTPAVPSAGDPARDWPLPRGDANWCFTGLLESSDQLLTATLHTADGAPPTPLTAWTYTSIDGPTQVIFRHTFPYDAPRDVYTLTVQLSGHQIDDRFVPAVGEAEIGGWRPNEAVRLIAFAIQPDGLGFDFVSNLYTRADAEGNLRLLVKSDADAPGLNLYAVGRSTPCRMLDTVIEWASVTTTCYGIYGDNFIRAWTYSRPSPLLLYWQPCRQAPRSQLRLRDLAQAIDASTVPVHARANSGSQVVGRLAYDDRVRVVAGPACAEGLVWWRVRHEDTGLTGWAAETDASNYSRLMLAR